MAHDVLSNHRSPIQGRHARKVARIVRELRDHAEHGAGRPLSFKKKAVSHQVPKRDDLRRKDEKIDVSDLDQILEIDAAAMTCTAEPGVTFVDLVAATMRHGLVPIVVPELKTITIGGAVSGCSLESMSFKYGGFHDTCIEYEVVTARGEVLRCTAENEHALVFQMMHGAFGTLGVLTKLRFRLVRAREFVHVTYERHRDLASFKNAIHRRYVSGDVDFMDAIIHSPTEYVLSLGRFVHRAPYTNSYDWMKVYWQSTAKRREDYLTTPDYFFRYDRGVTNVHPKSAIGRLLFGKLVDSSALLRIAEKVPFLLPKKQPDVTLDMFLPFSRLEAYMDWHRRELDFFPLWCVPYRRVRDYEWIAPKFFEGLADELFVDIAIYGMKQREGRNTYKEIEDALEEIGGIKTLISHNFYDEETFWRIWNQPNYRAVKQLTDPMNMLRDLYDKTCRASQGLPSPT